MRCSVSATTSMALVMLSGAAQAAFLVPDGVTPPFESWSRDDANSTYAEWDTFTNANSADGVNAPDVGSFGPAAATLSQTAPDPGGFAIIASSGNIYSFNSRTSFDVELPGYGLGVGYNTRVVAQSRTLGNVPDLGSVMVTYNDGVTDVSVAPDYVLQEEITSGGFSGLVSTFGWDLPGVNPSSLLFELDAAGSSMSLANLVVDTYVQTAAFPAFPPVVPEPASALGVSTALAVGLVGVARRRV